jgi:glycyl-tRNA synthetase
MSKNLNFEELTSYCKKKGILYPSCLIYGGLSGFYEYGHIGLLIKRNLNNLWRNYFLNLNSNFVEIEGSYIMSENVFKASGHISNFYDPIITIKNSQETFRADKLIEEKMNIRVEEKSNEELLDIIKSNKLLPKNTNYDDVEIENLNLMFEVNVGPKKSQKAYLRPETAQTPFVNFKTQFELQRKKLPLGIASIGRAYRNEISPKNLVLRTRELEQAELQIFFNEKDMEIGHNNFFKENENETLQVLLKNKREEKQTQKITLKNLNELNKIPKMYLEYMLKVQIFYKDILKIDMEKFRFYELNDKEKAFYNKVHFDIEYNFESLNEWVEIGGIHYRGNHDLSAHQKVSKQSLEVFDEKYKEKVLPNVLELSFGVGRNFLTLFENNLKKNEERGNLVLDINKNLAPYKIGIFPLLKKDFLINKSNEICEILKKNNIKFLYDETGSIGKRYSRADEIGITYCLCVDFESCDKNENEKEKNRLNNFTIRNIKTGSQEIISLNELINFLN